LASDTTICVGGEQIELLPKADLPNLEYLWSDGSNTQSLFISDKGEYWVEVSNGSCIQRAYVKVEEACYPVIHVPNAFSPNNDGDNDQFQVFGTRLFNYRISIYNKWGNLVFVSNDINQSWDGIVAGDLGNIGSYIYRISYQGRIRNEMVDFSQSGSVLLIR
jgi:gliding motility-associated-like protein